MATEYLILLAVEGEGWKKYATVKAASTDAAIRTVAAQNGVYAAVPVRSWTPRTVMVEQKKTVTFAKERSSA